MPDRDNIHRLACVLFSLVIFIGGFMAADGKIKMQKSWQGLTGKQLILQGVVEPDSIRRKEQGISAVFAAEWPLHGKVRVFVKTDSKNADLTVRKLLSGKIRIGSVLKEPVFLRNPGTYDGYHFNKIKGIYGNITVSPAQLQESGEPLPLRFRFTALAQKVRENALAQLHTGTGAILPGMVLGGYQGVAPEPGQRHSASAGCIRHPCGGTGADTAGVAASGREKGNRICSAVFSIVCIALRVAAGGSARRSHGLCAALGPQSKTESGQRPFIIADRLGSAAGKSLLAV